MTTLPDEYINKLIDNWLVRREEKRREILFRKFTVRKYPNHRKAKPVKRHVTTDYFNPHKKLSSTLAKLEKEHQYLTDEHLKRIYDGKAAGMPAVKLGRIAKKFVALSRKLKWLTGKD